MIVQKGMLLSVKRIICGSHLLILLLILVSCQKESVIDSPLSLSHLELNKIPIRKDTDSTIYISDDIVINDKIKERDTLFSYNNYERFLTGLVKSNRFIFVPLNEFNSTFSKDKVVISLRHDIDDDINSAVRFARREFKLGIRATYFVLNTSDYYGVTTEGASTRNTSVLEYIKKIQNEYNHEIGWHNDMVTLQVVYNIDTEKYLKNELEQLRNSGIVITGTAYHGSAYCYKYNYSNMYFWKDYYPAPLQNFSVVMNGQSITIKKFNISDFGFNYEAGLLKCTYFFADCFFFNYKRWHMNMENWSSFKPGDKVIILTHSALWD
jgi:hypothetical protein